MRVIRWMILFLCFSLCSARLDAGNELILRIRHLNEATVKSVQHHLKRLKGVEFWGYHVESSCLLITFDAKEIQEKEVIFNVAALLDQTTSVLPLKGYKIYDILDGKYIAQEEED